MVSVNFPTAVRYGLIFLAGYLGKKGLLPQELQGPLVDFLASFLPALLVAAWGFYEQTRDKLIEKTSQLPGVYGIAVTEEIAKKVPTSNVDTPANLAVKFA